MYLIPEVKSAKAGQRKELKGCTFSFPQGIDERIKRLCEKVPQGDMIVTFEIGNGIGEEYKITFSDKIEIKASSSKGAFYAVQTLRQIIKNGYYDVEEIEDAPDFENRGFYYDITRGRVHTLDTLKALVDNMAYYKLNMLQLYVEHTFPFKEYDGIYQKMGYMTAEETIELDKYCQENFVELVPSLSCFGHLYELLQNTKYKYLCELESFEQRAIYWCERMGHHTIDASNPESIELIKSLIDQYSPLFSSKKFNICCDETFDLCNGRNKGKDKGRMYVDFVKKVIAHVKSKGKVAMMWGDVITQHPELIDEFDEDVIFMSWGYSANESPNMVYKFRDAKRPQYVCPGVSNWTSLIEAPHTSVPNITKMTQYGYESGAIGVLNTCWGDYGQISPIYACMYGMIFGAARSWRATSDYPEFDKSIDLLYYGYDGAASFVKGLALAQRSCYWYHLLVKYSNEKFGNDAMRIWNVPSPDEINKAFEEIEAIIPYLMGTTWENEDARKSLLVVAEGLSLMTAMVMSDITGERLGVNLSDVERWLVSYKEEYLKESKMGELKEFIVVFYEIAQKYLK